MTPTEIDQLGTRGWFLREQFSGAARAAAIARQRVEAGLFTPAGVSRDHRLAPSVRGDKLLWISPGDSELTALEAGFEALRTELNRDAWLGLTRFEAQLAHYPGNGACYARHRDAFEGSADHRRVTAIVYLNERWRPPDGGQLKLHTEPIVELAPLLGKAVVFLAARIEHEVLPCWAPRLAATAWYYAS